MKKIFRLIIVLFTISVLTVVSFGLGIDIKNSLPCDYSGESIKIGPFDVIDCEDNVKEYLKKWKQSSSNMAFYSMLDNKKTISFVYLIDESIEFENNNIKFKNLKNKSITMLHYRYDVEKKKWTAQNGTAVHSSFQNEVDFNYIGLLHIGGNLKSVGTPIACIVGGNENKPYEFIFDDEQSSKDNGIMGFIKDFFKNLGEFFLKIFVPDKDYFKNYFNDIKSAIDVKLDGITKLKETLLSFFEFKDIKQSQQCIWHIPNDYLFEGFKGFDVDIFESILPVLSFVRPVLTAIIVLYTLIICYKKLITLFQGS